MANDIYALIPARRDSQGLPRKNIALINGEPLISFTISAAINASVFSNIVVSTNDAEVVDVARKSRIETLERPEGLANASANADSVVAHFIRTYQVSPLSVIVYLQPTSPLRTGAHIKRACEEFFAESARGLVSVVEVSRSFYKVYARQEDGTLSGLFGSDAPYCSRQSIPQLFLPNGAIYIFRVNEFMQDEQIPRSDIIPFIMDEQSSIDIDTLDDLTRVAAIIKKNE